MEEETRPETQLIEEQVAPLPAEREPHPVTGVQRKKKPKAILPGGHFNVKQPRARFWYLIYEAGSDLGRDTLAQLLVNRFSPEDREIKVLVAQKGSVLYVYMDALAPLGAWKAGFFKIADLVPLSYMTSATGLADISPFFSDENMYSVGFHKNPVVLFRTTAAYKRYITSMIKNDVTPFELFKKGFITDKDLGRLCIYSAQLKILEHKLAMLSAPEEDPAN